MNSQGPCGREAHMIPSSSPSSLLPIVSTGARLVLYRACVLLQGSGFETSGGHGFLLRKFHYLPRLPVPIHQVNGPLPQ